MRLLNYLNEGKLRLKRNGPGNYSAESGRFYVSVWQTEGPNKYWGAEITLGKYGDDDYEVENTHAQTKRELLMYIDTIMKRLSK